MFTTNEKTHNMEMRNSEKFQVLHANTERLKKSAVIFMQNLLNEQNRKWNSYKTKIKEEDWKSCVNGYTEGWIFVYI